MVVAFVLDFFVRSERDSPRRRSSGQRFGAQDGVRFSTHWRTADARRKTVVQRTNPRHERVSRLGWLLLSDGHHRHQYLGRKRRHSYLEITRPQKMGPARPGLEHRARRLVAKAMDAEKRQHAPVGVGAGD